MKPLTEAVKEGLRVVALAVLPVLVDSLTQGEVNWRFIAITGAVAALRFIDAWLHEVGKEEKNKLMEGGLTRF